MPVQKGVSTISVVSGVPLIRHPLVNPNPTLTTLIYYYYIVIVLFQKLIPLIGVHGVRVLLRVTITKVHFQF